MAIALKRYKDGTYTPLMKPWTRRMDYGTPKQKKGIVRRIISKGLDNAAEGLIRGTGYTEQEFNQSKKRRGY